MKYQFVEDHRSEFPVTCMCSALEVSTSGYYAWRTRSQSQREQENQELLERTRAIHADLVSQGIRCNPKRVARLMRLNGIRAKQHKRRRVRTTDSAHDLPVAPNVLNRQFEADAPNQKWVTDITYVSTDEGWLYLAVVLDLFSRRVIGWSMTSTLCTLLVKDALLMAIAERRPEAGLLHHSDRGSQYASAEYQTVLNDHHLVVSMSRAGNCYDNAPVESFFGTLKCELTHHRHYRTRAEARQDIFEYIEVFYNRKRRHSSLGYLSPVEYEQVCQLCVN